jgi:exonuclease VII small subunit
MAALVDDSLDLLDVLEKFQRGKRANEMKTLRGKLETASDRLAKDMDKMSGSDEAREKAAVPYYRAMVNFNGAFARWMKDPAMPMVSHSLASIRGVMNVCQKSLSAYK